MDSKIIRILMGLTILFATIFIFVYSNIAIYVILPIGAIPEERTVLM